MGQQKSFAVSVPAFDTSDSQHLGQVHGHGGHKLSGHQVHVLALESGIEQMGCHSLFQI